jgi:mRNA-degrading endonuclease RelE of RelBE toxin-antitoxin system
VEKDLKKLRAYDRKRILDEIERQLLQEPLKLTRTRKLLVNLIPPWPAVPPIWELRVGDHRVFYDVSVEERIVYVRAVRKKPAGRTSEEIL